MRKISHEIKEEEDESLSDSSIEPSNKSSKDPPKRLASVPAARPMINVEAFPEESHNEQLR